MAEVKREHREAVFGALDWYPQDDGEHRWLNDGSGYIGRSFPHESIVSGRAFSRLAQAIADAEQRGREAERSAVVAYLRRGLSTQGRVNLSHDIRAGKHLENSND